MELNEIRKQIEDQYEKNKGTIDQLLAFQEQLKGKFQLLQDLEKKLADEQKAIEEQNKTVELKQ